VNQEVLREEEKLHSGKARDGSSYGGETAKGPGERGQELKASRYSYNLKVVIQDLKVFY